MSVAKFFARPFVCHISIRGDPARVLKIDRDRQDCSKSTISQITIQAKGYIDSQET